MSGLGPKKSTDAAAMPSSPVRDASKSPKATTVSDASSDAGSDVSDYASVRTHFSTDAASAGSVPKTPHRPRPDAPAAAEGQAAVSPPPSPTDIPHRPIELPHTENWQEARFGSQTRISVIYRPHPGAKPVELVIHMSTRNQLTKASLDGPAGPANRTAFEDAIADLLKSVEEKKKLPDNWESLQLSIEPTGRIHNLVVFAPGKSQAIEVDDDEGYVRGAVRRFTDLLRGNDTFTITKKPMPEAMPEDEATKRARTKRFWQKSAAKEGV